MNRLLLFTTLSLILTGAALASQPILKSDSVSPEVRASLLAEQATQSIVAESVAPVSAPLRIAPPVPEPASMIALGAAAAVFMARRRRQAK